MDHDCSDPCLYCMITDLYRSVNLNRAARLHMAKESIKLREELEVMDKKIKKLQKSTDKVVKEEKSLLKADKKHDKIIDKAKKMKKGKC